MVRYLSRRLISSIIALFLFLTLMFFVTEILIPSDFTVQFSLTMTAAQREELRHELGLDLPLWQRYLRWVGNLVRGDLGVSFYGARISGIFKQVLPYTLLVFLMGTVVAFLVGQWIGKVTAWHGSGPISSTAVVSGIALYTAFPPWLAFLVTYFLFRRKQFAPILYDGFRSGFTVDPFAHNYGEIWRDAAWAPNRIMTYMLLSTVALALVLLVARAGLQRVSRRRLPTWPFVVAFFASVAGIWTLAGFERLALNVLSVAGIPIVTYVLLSFGETMLIMRTTMTDTLKEEYITTARAKGLPSRLVRDRHAARNALLPVFSRLIVSLPYMLTGLVIIEIAVRWPGLSRSMFGALYQQDIPTVMATLLLVGVVAAVARLALDVLYAFLDPRIRYDTGRLRTLG